MLFFDALGCEKAPQGIDNTLGTLVSKYLGLAAKSGEDINYSIKIPSQAEDDGGWMG